MPDPTGPAGQPGGVVAPADVEQLRAAIEGSIVTPADDGWDAARTPWNLAVDRSPALVALPASSRDVVAVVDFARAHGLRVAPQCTGHNAGSADPLAGAVLVSMGGMKGVEVDVDAATARVEAGAPWGAVTAACDPHGLFAMAGSSPGVGVTGYTLGGGLSWFGRRLGLAANHVTAIEVVTPAGQETRVTATSDPDLFWALRGGAANFGVVTALEFALFPYGHVTAGMFVWPYERHVDVLEAWHHWTLTSSDDVTTSLRIMHFPPMDVLPPFLSGKSVVVVDGVFAGDEDASRHTLAALRALGPEVDTWAVCSPAGLDTLHMDPPDPMPGVSTTMLVADLDAAALGRFSDAIPAGGALMFGELRQLGGALGHSPAGAGAMGHLVGDYCLYAVGVGTAAANPAIVPALATLRDAMAPNDTGMVFANFAEQPTDAGAIFGPIVLDRLRSIRATVDPHDLMLAGHAISL